VENLFLTIGFYEHYLKGMALPKPQGANDKIYTKIMAKSYIFASYSLK